MDGATYIAHPCRMPRVEDVSVPNQAATLTSLEDRIATLDEPAELLALATEIDELGVQLAYEISNAAQPELAAPLAPVLMRVPGVRTRTLLRAAERYDDLGSPKRAAYVLIEALRRAFDAATIAEVAAALSFLLDANDQAVAAARLRTIVTLPGDPPPGTSRREARDRLLAAIELLRESIDWTALDDELGTD